MLNSISTSNVGSPERPGVSRSESEQGDPGHFGDLLAGMDVAPKPSEEAPAPPPPKSTKADSKPEKEAPARENEAPVRTSLHAALADFLMGLPMPPMQTAQSAASAATATAPANDAGGAGGIANDGSLGPSASGATISLKSMDLAAFDVRAIHVQVESIMAAGPQAAFTGGIDGRILAELQGGLQQLLPGAVTAGPLEQSLMDAVQNAAQSSDLSSGANARPVSDVQPGDPLPELRLGESVAQVLTAIPAITDSSSHSASHQQSGGDHEKPTADQTSKGEAPGVAVPVNAPAQFESQLGRSEQAPVAHTPEPLPENVLPSAHRVSIDIGENESKVTVTLHERGGDVSMKIHSANQPLSTQLQSSVGSLIEALHREHVSLTNMDFSSGLADTADHANHGSSQGNTPQDSSQSGPRKNKVPELSIPSVDEGFPAAAAGINIHA